MTAIYRLGGGSLGLRFKQSTNCSVGGLHATWPIHPCYFIPLRLGTVTASLAAIYSHYTSCVYTSATPCAAARLPILQRALPLLDITRATPVRYCINVSRAIGLFYAPRSWLIYISFFYHYAA